MRNHTLIAALLWLVVLHAAAVAEEEAISDRGKTALGVSLDTHSKTSMSIWRVKPTTMWGFEMGYSSVDHAWQRYSDENSTLTLLGIYPSLTFKRFVGPLRHDVAPFLYQTVYTNVAYRREISWDVGTTFGVGALWCPFKRVSLAIRQGVTLQFQSKPGPFYDLTSLPESEHEYESTRRFEGENRIRLYANTTALYALVHF